MDISSKWEMDESLAVTVTAIDGGTTIEVTTPGCVNVSLGGWPYIGTALELMEGLPAKVREVVEVWEREDSIRKWLLHQVELEPVGANDWELHVNKGGLLWIWYLKPATYSTSLAVTLYLDIELPPDIPRVRQPSKYDVERYLCQEIRHRKYTVGEAVIPLHRVNIPCDVAVITIDTLRQCMSVW